jgi:ADP-ribosyl-[dinitrogen reductase] hydrolase
MAERKDQPHFILRVATLDDDPGTPAVGHIWTSHDVPWLKDANNVRWLPEGPPPR